MAKLKGEMFWLDRWMLSSARQLPLEARGLYREMLSAAWMGEAALPNDAATIKRLVACTDDEWQRCWPLVRRYWREGDGIIVNDTQVEIYRDSVQRQERASSAAKQRWQRQVKATLSSAHPKTHANTHPKTHPKTNSNAHRRKHMPLTLSLSLSQKQAGTTSTQRARARKKR